MADLIVKLPGDLAQPAATASVQTLTIAGDDFKGKTFSVVNCETFDTGLGALNKPLMPIPTILLGIFGTEVKLQIGGLASDYNPETGEIEQQNPKQVTVKGYPEAYTLQEKAEIPEIQENDLRLYLPGEGLGYQTAALVLLQIRQIGFTIETVER